MANAATERVRPLVTMCFIFQLWSSIQVIAGPARHLGSDIIHLGLACFASAVPIVNTVSNCATITVQVCASSMVQMCAWVPRAYWSLFAMILAVTLCLGLVIVLCTRLLVAVLQLAASATEHIRASCSYSAQTASQLAWGALLEPSRQSGSV